MGGSVATRVSGAGLPSSLSTGVWARKRKISGRRPGVSETPNFRRQLGHCALEVLKALLIATLGVGGSVRSDKVTVRAKMQRITTMQAARTNARTKPTRTTTRFGATTLPTRRDLWCGNMEGSWEEPDRNKSQQPKTRCDPNDGRGIFENFENFQQSLIGKSSKTTTNCQGNHKGARGREAARKDRQERVRWVTKGVC